MFSAQQMEIWLMNRRHWRLPICGVSNLNKFIHFCRSSIGFLCGIFWICDFVAFMWNENVNLFIRIIYHLSSMTRIGSMKFIPNEWAWMSLCRLAIVTNNQLWNCIAASWSRHSSQVYLEREEYSRATLLNSSNILIKSMLTIKNSRTKQ